MRNILLFAILQLFIVLASAQNETFVYFSFDQYALSNHAKQTLDSIVANNKTATITIYGHTDQLGTKSYNYTLSLKRAYSVKDYLFAKGFSAANLSAIEGLGEDEPVIDRLDAISRKANRRVTVGWLSMAVKKISDTISPAVEEPAPMPPVVDTYKPITQPQPKLEDEIRDLSTKEGQNIILKNINFYGGMHRFLPQALKPLDELLDVMRNIPTLEIEIQGHICCEDKKDGMDWDTGKRQLSRNRAKAVYDFLWENGISKKRMRYKGFGHRFPIYQIEKNEAERTINRRVEIKILKK